MRLRITAETIEETHSEQELSFDNPAEFTTLNKKTLTNTLDLFPVLKYLIILMLLVQMVVVNLIG